MKTLYLVRHAKSSWDDPSLNDQQRPLNKRGHKAALLMGERLKQRSVTVEQIVSSPALRALTTARYLADAIAYEQKDIIIERELYFSGVDEMLALLHDCDPDIESLMLVGHNPDMTSFSNFLCGYHSSNMPTCAISTIQFDKQWKKIGREDGTLLNYDYPKKEYAGS
jgi:phosphohistidine phosphatase